MPKGDNGDCCEIPVCLLIVDVDITEEAQAKLTAILSPEDNGEDEIKE